MDVQAVVAWNIRRLRTGRGLSQEALAVDAEIDRSYMSGLERGLENPTVRLLARLAEALSCEIAEFFSKPAPGEEPPRPLRRGRKASGRSRGQPG